MPNGVPLSWFLYVGAALFCLGAFVVLTRRNAVAILMGVELMLNAAGLNFVAFAYNQAVAKGTAASALTLEAVFLQGHAFTIFLIVLAACEVAVALAILIAIFRNFRTIEVTEVATLKD